MTIRNPREAFEQIQIIGTARAHQTIDEVFVLSFMSGMYIGLGGLFAIVVGGNMPEIQKTNPGLQRLVFGTAFSVGVMFVNNTGCDLWTSITTLTNVALLSSKTSIVDVIHTIKTLVVSFVCNFFGGLFVAYFFCYLLNMHSTEPWVTFLINLGNKKTTTGPWFLFISAIGCNILLSTGVYITVVSQDVSGNILAIVIAMGTFSTIGFEHFVANAFILPAAAFFGADISGWKLLFWNLAVVGLGNYIGGVFFFGFLFWYAHMWRPSNKSFCYDPFSNIIKRIAHQTPSHSAHQHHFQVYHQYELAT